MLLVLSNTPISKHHCLCLNSCLDIPTKLKFYVKNLVTKHNLDLNCKSPLYRKIGPLQATHFFLDFYCCILMPVHISNPRFLFFSGYNTMITEAGMLEAGEQKGIPPDFQTCNISFQHPKIDPN